MREEKAVGKTTSKVVLDSGMIEGTETEENFWEGAMLAAAHQTSCGRSLGLNKHP